jgi:PAS domain S-box-containing protein
VRRGHITVGIASLSAVVVLTIAALTVARANRHQEEAWRWVSHTFEVIGRLQQVDSLAYAAESAERGYLLSRGPDWLREMRAAEHALAPTVEAIASLTRDNPRQQAAIPALRQLAEARVHLQDDVVEHAGSGAPDAAAALRGREAMQALTQRVAAMLAEEDRLLAIRQAEATHARRQVVVAVAGMGALALLLVGLLRWLSRRDARLIAQRIAEVEAVFRAAPAGLGMVGRDLRLSAVNDALARFLGRRAQEAIGCRPAEILDDATGRQLEAMHRQVLETGEAVTGVQVTRALAGREPTDWLASFQPVGAGDARSAAVVAVLDVTPLKRAQRELADANRLLEARVAERTAQLVSANEDLEAFAHTVAHDLRAPLRNIEGFSSALIEDEADRLSTEGQVYLTRLRSGVRRMDGLITDLLAYSRLAREELQLAAVSLSSAIAQALQELEPEIRRRGARVELPPRLPDVLGSRTLLVQVFANLVGNALKFVAPGVAPHVVIDARRAGDRVSVTIDDNGIGILPEHRDRIFGVFERLHGQESYPGSGIGLAIVRRAVAKMNGRVAVSDGPQGGARFEIELCAAADEAE